MKKFIKILFSGILASSFLLSSVNVFANQVVRISIGSTKASVNGQNTTLSIAPYIQQPSESMMIPLRFVSVGLGIDEDNIKFNPKTKEITITYNDKTAKFIAGTNKLILNGEEFSMLIENTHPVYTEIKNGSTFIPLRSLELAFGVKIDWEASTKTAILSSGNEKDIVKQEPTQPTIEEIAPVEENTVKTFEDYTDEEIRAMEEEVVRLVNEERAKYGLQPLEISEKLMQTAKIKSKDMSTRNYFSHTDPDGYTLYQQIENLDNYWTIMENIASMGMSPRGVVNGWLNSKKGHREQILNPYYKYIGVGVCGSKWTQHFSKDDKWANEN